MKGIAKPTEVPCEDRLGEWGWFAACVDHSVASEPKGCGVDTDDQTPQVCVDQRFISHVQKDGVDQGLINSDFRSQDYFMPGPQTGVKAVEDKAGIGDAIVDIFFPLVSCSFNLFWNPNYFIKPLKKLF